jgi:hypothetical protein
LRRPRRNSVERRLACDQGPARLFDEPSVGAAHLRVYRVEPAHGSVVTRPARLEEVRPAGSGYGCPRRPRRESPAVSRELAGSGIEPPCIESPNSSAVRNDETTMTTTAALDRLSPPPSQPPPDEERHWTADPATAIRDVAGGVVDRIIEVAFSDNIDLDAAAAKNKRSSPRTPHQTRLRGLPPSRNRVQHGAHTRERPGREPTCTGTNHAG